MTDNNTPNYPPSGEPNWQQQPNPYAAAGWQQPTLPANQPSPKSFTITWILSLLVGYFGVDRFYLGKVGTGLMKLFTAGGVGIWYLIDLIMTLTGNATDKQGHKVVGTGRQPMIAWVVSAVVIGVSLISSGVSTLNSASEIPAAVTSVSTPRSTPTQEATTAPEPEPVVETEEAKPAETAEAVVEEESTGTVSQQQALSTAEDYLAYMPFSRVGLIEQLEYEGFSNEDATYAVDNVGADWAEQAVLSAESYLDVTAFSRDGLVDQLVYEGFTDSEATNAVDSLDVDWNEQAALSAQQYLDYSSFSHQGLVDQLIFEGFTAEQAEYGVTAVGL